jgi:hypothetical protein
MVKLNFSDIVEDSRPDSPGNHLKVLKYNGNLIIFYNSRLSKIIFLKQKIYFEKDGHFDQTGMSVRWEGEMMNQRLGDMLPYTYKYN